MTAPHRIKVCVAGATGWTGSLVTKHILRAHDLQLTGAIARQKAGQDIGEVLGLPRAGLTIAASFDTLAEKSADVLIDYTKPDSVKARTLAALGKGMHVVIGTSGLTQADYEEIETEARRCSRGVIAAGNFSITAALASHFAQEAAKYLPSWEIIDYAHAGKIDAPSGTVRELAEKLGQTRKNELGLALDKTMGPREARGATIGGTQVHSVRLPSYTIAFETIFGLPNERLTIRHDSGADADPYVAGTLLAVRRVIGITGLIRGLDRLLFQ